MPQPEPTLPSKQVEKVILKGVKKAIAASGIDPTTRSGNKELSHLVSKLAQHSFTSLEAATQLGEAVGQKIVALSQQLGKTHLDRSVIWQLALQKSIPAAADFAAASPGAAPWSAPGSPVSAKSAPEEQEEPITAGPAVEEAVEEEALGTANTANTANTVEESPVEDEADEVEEPVAKAENPVAKEPAGADAAAAAPVAAAEDAVAEEPDAEAEADEDAAAEADAEEPDAEEVRAGS